MSLLRLDRLSRLCWRGVSDAMRPTVVKHHELDHGSQAAPLLFSRCHQGCFHAEGDSNAYDFGFCDSQCMLLCEKR